MWELSWALFPPGIPRLASCWEHWKWHLSPIDTFPVIPGTLPLSELTPRPGCPLAVLREVCWVWGWLLGQTLGERSAFPFGVGLPREASSSWVLLMVQGLEASEGAALQGWPQSRVCE